MTNILFLSVGGLTLLAGMWRAFRVINRGGTRGLAITLLALGAALVLLAGSVQRLESMIYPSLGRLLSNVCTLTAAYGLLITVSELSGETAARRRRWLRLGIYVAAVAALAVSFFATSGLPHGLGLFGELYATHPTLVVYIVVYTLYLAVAVVSISRILVLSLSPARGALRAGLISLLVGCVLALAYLADKVAGVWIAVTAPSSSEPLCVNPVSSVSCALSVAAPAVSVLVSAVGVTLIAVGARHTRQQALAELAPLHRAIVARVPDLTRHRVVGGSGDRLVRTVAEIRDGLLQLGIADLDPESATRALWEAASVPRDTSPAAVGADVASTVWGELDRLRPIARAYRDLSAAYQ